MNVHEIKVHSRYVDALLDGSKTFEVRWNDRGYAVGDELVMSEVHSLVPGLSICVDGERTVRRTISYVLAADASLPGLLPGWVVLGLQSEAGVR